jgi:uncharacterized protein YkwD
MLLRLLVVLGVALTVLVGPWPVARPLAAVAADLPFAVASAEVAPASVTAGETATFEARVEATAAATATIEAAVRDEAGAEVWRQTWEERRFRKRQSRAFKATWAVPAEQPGGGYTLTVRVLDADGVEASAPRDVAFAVIGANAPPADAPPAAPAPADGLTGEEAAFLALINDYRQAHGLTPLTVQPHLTAAARWHSDDMAANRYFSHTDSEGRDPFRRMADFGYTANTWKGENIAAGYGTAAQVFAGWKSSPGHNANMLNAHFQTIGIGRIHLDGSPYRTYWTTDFGGE